MKWVGRVSDNETNGVLPPKVQPHQTLQMVNESSHLQVEVSMRVGRRQILLVCTKVSFSLHDVSVQFWFTFFVIDIRDRVHFLSIYPFQTGEEWIFRTTRVRIWRIHQPVSVVDPLLFQIEYLVAKDQFEWITLHTDQVRMMTELLDIELILIVRRFSFPCFSNQSELIFYMKLMKLRWDLCSEEWLCINMDGAMNLRFFYFQSICFS